MKIKRFRPNRHILELIPLLFILSLLPFLDGGESELAKLIFLAFPLAYLPVLFLGKRTAHRSFRLIFWAWMALLFVVLVSTFTSISLSFSVPALFELVGVFFYFIFFYLIVDRLSDLRTLSFSIIVVGFILSAVSLFLIISPPQSLRTMNLIYAKHGHNHLADYLIFVLPISIGLFLQQKKKIPSLLSAFLVSFFFISFYLTFARAALLIVSLMTLSLIWFFKPALKKVAFLLFFGLVPLVLIAAFFLVSHSRLGTQLFVSNTYKSNWLWRQVIKPLQYESRLEYWRQAGEGFALRPLFGNGPGTFRLTSRRFQQKPDVTSWFAHNSLLQTASELGIFGFIFFVLLLLLAAYKIKILPGKSPYTVALLVGVAGSLLQSLLDFNFDFLAIFFLFWALIAVLLKLSSKVPKRSCFLIPRCSLLLASFACFLFVISALFSNYFSSLATLAQLSSDKPAFTYYKISAFLPAFDNKRFSRLLQFLQANPNFPYEEQLINSIILWNRESSEIYTQLATLYPNQEIYETLITFDPFNSPRYFMKLSHQSLQQNDLESALHYLEAAAEVSIKYKAFIYPKLIEPKPISINLPENNPRLNQAYEELLKTIATDSFTQPYSLKLAKTFYALGLIAFQHFEPRSLTANLWQTAVTLYPEESDFHVELTNLYLKTGRKDQAQQALKCCQRLVYTREHCRQYYEDNLLPNSYEEVGFLKESIKAP